MKKLGKKSLLGLLIISIGIMSFSSVGYAGIFLPPPRPPRGPLKIGIFIWSSEVCTQSIIDGYEDILRDEGYITFFNFPDCHIYSALDTIDAFEKEGDTLFFYFYGHGEYDENTDNSRFYYKSGLGISSYPLRTELDQLEAHAKGFLIDSCYSGGFVDDFNDEPYLAMSSADIYHKAKGIGEPPGPGKFSTWFWLAVSLGMPDISAFNFACQFTSSQHPQISDMSDHTFFAS